MDWMMTTFWKLFRITTKVCLPVNACTFSLFDEVQDGGPTLEIIRLGEVYQIDGGAFPDKVVVDIRV